jgi:hypothetical protein
MSASNWARCPRCVQRAEEVAAELKAETDRSYGKVSAEAFDIARMAYSDLERRLADEWVTFRTFREDYEIFGAEEGTVKVSYSGWCDVCRLGFNFSHERELPV